ncbi:MAG: hypothetical protein M1839_005361 [Geoglossum umbratile]|nr:MAG: hypothetical protein M1839_005361 [Geoglossum umbratile]
MPPQGLPRLKTRLDSIAKHLTEADKDISSGFEKLEAYSKKKQYKGTLSNFQKAVEAYHDKLGKRSLDMLAFLQEQAIWDDKNLFESAYIQEIENTLWDIYGRIMQLKTRALEDMVSKDEKETRFRLERLEIKRDEFEILMAGFIDKILGEKENALFDMPLGAKRDKYGIYDPASPNKPEASPTVQPDAELAQVVTGIGSIGI